MESQMPESFYENIKDSNFQAITIFTEKEDQVEKYRHRESTSIFVELFPEKQKHLKNRNECSIMLEKPLNIQRSLSPYLIKTYEENHNIVLRSTLQTRFLLLFSDECALKSLNLSTQFLLYQLLYQFVQNNFQTWKDQTNGTFIFSHYPLQKVDSKLWPVIISLLVSMKTEKLKFAIEIEIGY